MLFDRIKTRKIAHGPLADYDVLQLLGKGGFAAVFSIRDRQSKQELAVKVMNRVKYCEHMGDTVESMRHRLTIMKTLSGENAHPNVMQVFGGSIDETQPDFYVFVEWMRGSDLYSRVCDAPGGRLAEDDAKQVAKALTSAVAHLHSLGIIHRDIKPENALFRHQSSPFSQVVLSDFGLSLIECQEDTLFRGVAGSIGYMAPEMAMNRTWGMLVDEFSLGVTLYECLTGRTPFSAGRSTEYVQELAKMDHLPFPSRYWSKLSLESRKFVAQLTSIDPGFRLSSTDAPSHAWLVDGSTLIPLHTPPLAEGEVELPYPRLGLSQRVVLTTTESCDAKDVVQELAQEMQACSVISSDDSAPSDKIIIEQEVPEAAVVVCV